MNETHLLVQSLMRFSFRHFLSVCYSFTDNWAVNPLGTEAILLSHDVSLNCREKRVLFKHE